MSLRPLYLEAGRTWHVCLDGPALRIETVGRAPTRAPLAKLARVISPQDSQWTTQALIACLKAGVPIVFTDRNAEVQAWCFGPRRRETTLTALVREGLARIDGLEVYETWHRATERRAIASLLGDLRIFATRAEVGDARGRVCNHLRARLGFPPAGLLRALDGAMGAYVAEQLHIALGDASLIGYAREGLHLGRSITALMRWEAYRALAREPIHHVHSATPQRLAAGLLESGGAQMASALGSHLGDLERYLREWLL